MGIFLMWAPMLPFAWRILGILPGSRCTLYTLVDIAQRDLYCRLCIESY